MQLKASCARSGPRASLPLSIPRRLLHTEQALAIVQIVALTKNNFERYRERIILQ